MGGIETEPALGQHNFKPRMTCLVAKRSVAIKPRRQIAGNVTCRHARQAQHSNGQMREILTYPGPRTQHLVDVRMNIRGARLISELVTNPRHYAPAVIRYWLVHPRPYHPEEFLKLLTEGDVAARTQEIVLLLRAHPVTAQKMLETVVVRQLARRHAFDQRIRTYHQLGMGRMNRYRMHGVPKSVAVIDHRRGRSC